MLPSMRVGPSVSEREAEQAKSGESGHSHLQVWLVGPAFVGEGEPGPSLSLSAEQGLATSTNLLVIETIITITALCKQDKFSVLLLLTWEHMLSVAHVK
jgi:hypothetical protein